MALKYAIVLFALMQIEFGCSGDGEIKLSRRKRYVGFPEGASFTIALCMTNQALVTPSRIYTQGVLWGMGYDLPNRTVVRESAKFPKYVMQRRFRRDLYQKMELVMDAMGYNGRSCIFRSLCETAGFFRGRGETVLEEIIRIIFKFPENRLHAMEHEDHGLYKNARKLGKSQGAESCESLFSDCSFSLIDMALGYYAESIPTMF